MNRWIEKLDAAWRIFALLGICVADWILGARLYDGAGDSEEEA